MDKEYLIIHKSILPEFFDLVLRARDLIDNEGYNVSAACQKVDISRSTFYKYKDYIFYHSKDFGRKAIFAVKTYDQKGVLSNILNVVYENSVSVISINQAIPIKNSAYITLTLDLQEYREPIEELVKQFNEIKYVRSVSILAID